MTTAPHTRPTSRTWIAQYAEEAAAKPNGHAPTAIRVVQGDLHDMVEPPTGSWPRCRRACSVTAASSPMPRRLTQSLKLKSGITVPADAIILDPVTEGLAAT